MKYSITKLAILIFFISIVCATGAHADSNTANIQKDLLVAQIGQKYLYGVVLENQSGTGAQRSTKEGIGVAGNKRLKIINLGPAVNSDAEDYAPTVTANGKMLYFVSNRVGSKELPNGRLSTDFWAFTKAVAEDTVFTSANVYNIDTSPDVDQLGLNTILNEGVATISADGKTLYFTGCNRPDGYGDCDIYMASINGDKFGKPINLGRNINSSNFDSQPSISLDGKRLYFTSASAGPNSSGDNVGEEMDIWYSEWDEDLDEWKQAVNLEAINTSGKDCSPFICPDGKSLLFSSDRSGGSGGLDFYVTYHNPATRAWSAPENLGQPLNTRDDEQFITISGNLTELYFSSSRGDISGNQGGLDLYMGVVPTYPRTIIITGIVTDACTDDPVVATVSVTNKLTGKKVENTYDESKKSFSHVLTVEDFGTNRAEEITLEISASHPAYETKVYTQKVKFQPYTEDIELSKKHADSIYIKIPVGLQPKLTPVIAEAEYIASAKGKNPSLANFRGLVMQEVLNWSLHPMLTYVFFDEGSSELATRYQTMQTSDATRNFTDTTIVGTTLSKYYHILNVFGFRLNQYPDETIEIIGCIDDQTQSEKRAGLAQERAEVVFNYLKDVWKIAPERMKVSHRGAPANPSNKNDSLGRQENRRVEIVSSEWEVYKPIFDKDLSKLPQPDDMKFSIANGVADELVASKRIVIKHGTEDWITIDNIGANVNEVDWDWTSEDGKYPADNQPFSAQLFIITKSGAVCYSEPVEIPVMQVSTQERLIATNEEKTIEDYSLILFQFNSDKAGPVNERVMRDYVYGRVFETSDIIVTGHTDIIGLLETNMRLSERRANTVRNGIQKESGGKYANLRVSGVGPNDPLYPNNIPEGRFYNRTVHVHIESTIRSATE